VLLPFSLLPFFINRQIISSRTLSERKDRNIPLIITTILYGTTSYIIFKFPIPGFLKSFIFATAFLSFLVTIINFRWKISLHSVGAGALIAIVLILSFKMLVPLEGYLISTILAAGLILSSRLKLNLHNPQQVWFGLLTGFCGLLGFMMYFQ
jgi:membrane-associated phospholipid phosphatase